jgi:hypothetical protein
MNADDKTPRRKLALTFEKFCEEQQTLEEGLIVSYGSDKLKAAMFGRYKPHILDVEDVPLFADSRPYKYGKPNSLTFVMSGAFDPDAKFRSMLDLGSSHIYQLEPKYPIKMNKHHLDNLTFFHVTTHNKAMKILQTGLVPKPSGTKFHHPGNRVYLMATNRPHECIKGLKKTIAENKGIQLDEMVALEIDASKLTNTDLYADESFTSNPKCYHAVFVLKPIYSHHIRMSKW